MFHHVSSVITIGKWGREREREYDDERSDESDESALLWFMPCAHGSCSHGLMNGTHGTGRRTAQDLHQFNRKSALPNPLRRGWASVLWRHKNRWGWGLCPTTPLSAPQRHRIGLIWGGSMTVRVGESVWVGTTRPTTPQNAPPRPPNRLAVARLARPVGGPHGEGGGGTITPTDTPTTRHKQGTASLSVGVAGGRCTVKKKPTGLPVGTFFFFLCGPP